jgi:hypothetical protein
VQQRKQQQVGKEEYQQVAQQVIFATALVQPEVKSGENRHDENQQSGLQGGGISL